MALNPVFPGHPRQGWQYKVEIDGFDAAWFVGATIPTTELEVDNFSPAGSNRDQKFSGRVTTGDCVLEKGMPADGADMAAWEWLTAAQDPSTGVAGSPGVYRREIAICHVNGVGETIQRWEMKEVWCKKIEYSKNEGTSEHVVETITLDVGVCKPVRV